MNWDELDEPRGYDNGGWLRPGVTRVLNFGGKPDPVYDPAASIEASMRYIDKRYGNKETE